MAKEKTKTSRAQQKLEALVARRPEWIRTRQGEPSAEDLEDLALGRSQGIWRRQECPLRGDGERRLHRLLAAGDAFAEIRLYCDHRGWARLLAVRGTDATGPRRVLADGVPTLTGYQFEVWTPLLDTDLRFFVEFEETLAQEAQCVFQVLHLPWDLRHALLAGRVGL